MLTQAEQIEHLKALVAHYRQLLDGLKGEPQDLPDELARASLTVRSLFRILLWAEGRMLTRSAMFEALYGMRPFCDQPDEAIVDVWITKLRKFLKTYRVQTHWGRGYSLHKIEGDAP